MAALFVTEGLDGVDGSGPQGGNEAGQGGAGEEERGDGDEDENIDVVAPIPNARERMATTAKPGFLSRPRRP